MYLVMVFIFHIYYHGSDCVFCLMCYQHIY